MNAQLKEVPEIDTPRIYVACLASYNNGILHGAWVDAVNGVDAMRDDINAMLKASPIPNAEEWDIHDTISLGNYDGSCLETISEIAEFISEHGEIAAELLAHYHDINYCKEKMEDHYSGAWDSKRDFVYGLVDDCGWLDNANKIIKNYFDYEMFERDLFINDYVDFYVNGQYHIFSNH